MPNARHIVNLTREALGDFPLRGLILSDLHGQEVTGELIQIISGACLEEILEFEGAYYPEGLRAPGAEEIE